MSGRDCRIGHTVARARALLISVSCLMVVSSASAGELPVRALPISYVTSDLVYLSGGRADGIAPGDTGIVRRSDSIVAYLEVAHVATHSASCRILQLLGAIGAGDTAHVQPSPATEQETPVVERRSADTGHTPDQLTRHETRSRASSGRINGVASARVTHFVSSAGAARDYTLSNLGLNLRASDLWGHNLELTIRTSGRGNHRSSPAGGAGLNSDWSGRISTFSLLYASERLGTRIQAGRVPISRLGRLGGLDGMVIEQPLSALLRVGLFAGFQPRWQYSDHLLATHKAGAYVNWRKGERKSTVVDLTAGAAGEYLHGVPSREVLLIQGRAGNARWSLSQSAEIDVNRGWRRQNSGESISLSGIYLSGRYRASSWVTGTVSYDSRKDYWTYEERTLADSLFDDNLRQGLRAQADISLPSRTVATLGLGYRNRQGDPDPTISYTLGLRSSGFAAGRLSLSTMATGFDGPAEDGYDLSARLGASILPRLYFDAGSGYYAYQSVFTTAKRTNRWVEGMIRATVSARLVLNAGYRLSSGDDLSGHRVEAGITAPF